MILLDSIHDYLVAQLIAGGVTGWSLYKGFLPDKSDQAVTIYETPGLAPENETLDTIYRPAFQIRVRGPVFDYEATRAKMQEVRESVHDADISGLVYVYATQSGPVPLGNDGNDRPNLTMNFRTMEA